MAISLTKNGNAIVFAFDDNSHYLNDGTIEVPVNSLTLVTDESNMFTFKKAASDDIFISGLYSEIGMSKSELIAWYKDNMVGSTGGGGVTSGEVQTMIDESISGLAESSAVTEEISAAVSGKADSSAVTASINAAVSGKMDTSAFNTYSASTDARISEDEEVTSAALNEVNDALSGKADTTAVTESINAAVSGKADTSAVTASITAAVSGKQDTLVSGTNIKTINNESLLGSGNINIQGGGKAIEAGRGIAITTGATADTVSFDLSISAGTGSYSLIFGRGTQTGTAQRAVAFGQGSIGDTRAHNSAAFGTSIVKGQQAFSEGGYSNAIGNNSHAEGNQTSAYTSNSHTEGSFTITSNENEHASGEYNSTTSGASTSAQTLFSVGNGTSANARHNAFEIRKNGDIYITSGGTDIKLQDNLGGGGGLPESAFTAYTAATEARLAEDEEVTAAGLNALNDALSGKQDTLIAGTNITISGNVISAEGGSVTVDQTLNSGSTNPVANSAITTALNDTVKLGNLTTYYINGFTADVNRIYPIFHRFDINNQSNGNAWWFGKINDKYVITTGQTSISPSGLMNLQVIETSAITTSVTSSSTDSQVPSAKAVYDQLGGLKLVKLTQSEYDALSPNYDSNTLYVIIN